MSGSTSVLCGGHSTSRGYPEWLWSVLLGDLQELPGLGLGQPALGGPCMRRRLEQLASRGPFQSQPFCEIFADLISKMFV